MANQNTNEEVRNSPAPPDKPADTPVVHPAGGVPVHTGGQPTQPASNPAPKT